MKHVFYPDGTEKEFIYEAQEGKNRIIERDGKSFNYFYSRTIDYDKNNNVEYVSEHADNYSTHKEIKYADGVPYSVNEDKQTTIKNNVLEKLGVLSDNDLKPHKKFNFLSDAQNIEGEKTYYSNGSVETNTFMQEGKKYKYTYLANGDLINVESDNIFVEYGGEAGYTIHENLEDGAKKETTYLPDGTYHILYKKGDIEKMICYIDGKVSEYNYSVNGIGTNYLFDQEGNLKDVYESEHRRD